MIFGMLVAEIEAGTATEPHDKTDENGAIQQRGA
jgi:hypothetical protein